MRSASFSKNIPYEILNQIRTNRNRVIKTFLDESHLTRQILLNFPGNEISPGKIQLAMNDLMESLIAPVDTKRYKAIIQVINAQHPKETDLSPFEQLFFDEIMSVIRRSIL